MIISCPKCKVKFKINDNKIPSSGRLVQCSKCSHKWQALGKAEISSETGKIIVLSFLVLFVGSLIVFGNQIPMPESLILWIEKIGIPINEGELFGRSYKR